nr:hypothetical protein [Oscillospiraceae bacterium]
MENYTEQSPKPSIRGIHITGMNAVIIAASLVLYILLTATAQRVSATLRATYQATNDFYVSTQNEALMLEGTDYLTEQARLYVVTLDRTYIDNYITELNDTHRRETALERLLESDLGEEVNAYWHAALEKSGELVEQELYALRLAADSRDETLPEALRDVELREEDAVLSQEEKLDKAKDLLFGTALAAAKQQVKDHIESAGTVLNGNIQI